jgi:hypothetical protein
MYIDAVFIYKWELSISRFQKYFRKQKKKKKDYIFMIDEKKPKNLILK